MTHEKKLSGILIQLNLFLHTDPCKRFSASHSMQKSFPYHDPSQSHAVGFVTSTVNSYGHVEALS